MKKGSIVIVNLQNPREKVLGILLDINTAGLTIRGIDVHSFNDWTNSLLNEESEVSITPTTVFFPMHRVLSCYIDEDSGPVPSFSTQFKQKTSINLKDILK
ncbi:conserved hypothetical protein [Thermotomaculum hydrothermale]|uniref:Uncharacterized protein n=1 Tax=Thermotomaculum hydrothermale TaxID=981385 RepID=A0A7R6PER4_9BACT|nr:hypothetical protein [Thermotomaculum hydrothermale]BBB32358.1 conserved hypothetical protein [Thermotomaculum hydrothermale]